MKRAMITLAAILALAGCATTGAKAPAQKASMGTLNIYSQMPSVSVYIDDEFYGNAFPGGGFPQSGFALPAGTYKVRASAPGYEDFETSIRLTPNNTHTLLITPLRPQEGQKAARLRDEQLLVPYQQQPFGTVVLADIPAGSAVYVDGKLHGQAVKSDQSYQLSLPVGLRRITVVRPSGVYNLVLDVRSGSDQRFLVGQTQAPPLELPE